MSVTKRFLSLLLCGALLVCLLPVAASAQSSGLPAPVSGSIYDQTLDFSALTADATGAGYTWEHSTQTLTLTDITVNATDGSGIIVPSGATVRLSGANCVCGAAYGLEVQGSAKGVSTTSDHTLSAISGATGATNFTGGTKYDNGRLLVFASSPHEVITNTQELKETTASFTSAGGGLEWENVENGQKLTLTLTNVVVIGGISITTPDGESGHRLTIKLEGVNLLYGSTGLSCSVPTVTLTGTGALFALGGSSSTAAVYGVHFVLPENVAKLSLTIDCGALTAVASSCSSSRRDSDSTGVCIDNGTTASTLTIGDGGEAPCALTVMGGKADARSQGLDYNKLGTSEFCNATITAVGGTAGTQSRGVNWGGESGSLSIGANCTLTARGGTSGDASIGIATAEGTLLVLDEGKVTAIGGAATQSSSSGIHACVDLQGGEVYAAGGSSTEAESAGIHFSRSHGLTVSGGLLTATTLGSGKEGTFALLDYGYSGSAILSGGTVKLTGSATDFKACSGKLSLNLQNDMYPVSCKVRDAEVRYGSGSLQDYTHMLIQKRALYEVAVTLTLDGGAYGGQSVQIKDGGTPDWVYTLEDRASAGRYTHKAVPNASYTIYRDNLSTGKTVTVQDAKGSADVAFFTVDFDTNGGTATPDQVIAKDHYAAQPTGVTNGEKTLSGWYADSAFQGAAWDFAANPVTTTTTLYAKWLNSDRAITAYSIDGVNGSIDEAAGTIALTLPYGTDATALTADFRASANAVVTVDGRVQTSGMTANNFTSPVVYTVTSQNGMTKAYTVTVQLAVATPTFSPAAGSYARLQRVSIACATSGATIRYTTNGSEPTESSSLYSAPLLLTTSTTLKAKAFKAGLADSKVASATYSKTRDSNDPPTISYTITASCGAGGTISPLGAVEVPLTGTQSFRMAAYNGYRIQDVLVDGRSMGAVSEYRFTSVKANHTITVSFEAIADTTSATPPTNTAANAPRVYAVNVNRLNVRTGPGTNYPKASGGTLKRGTLVTALEQRGDWIKIGEGQWLFLNCLLPQAASDGEVALCTRPTTRYRVTARRLNLRPDPSTAQKALGTIAQGAVVEACERTTDGWLRIHWNGNHYWVAERYTVRLEETAR